MKYISAALLSIYTFFYIFNPYNFTIINPIHLMFIIALFGFIWNWRDVVSFVPFPGTLYYLYYLIASFSYLIILYLFFYNEVAFQKIYNYFVSYIEVPICALFIIYILNRFELFRGDIFRLLFVVVLIQLLFVFLCLFFAEFREWVIQTSKVENFEVISNQFGWLRSYGLGSGLTYSLPMLMGLSSVIFASKIFTTRRVFDRIAFLLLFVMSVTAVLLNAQTGFIPFILYFLLFISSRLIKFKVGYLFLLFFFFIFLYYSFMFYGVTFDSFMSNNLNRTVNAFNDVYSLMNGTPVGFFATILEMHFVPTSQTMILFGEGVELYGSGSDVGYVRDIYSYGLFGLFINICFVFFLSLFSAVCLNKRFGLIVALAIFLSIPIFYAKGMLFLNNDVFNAAFLIFIFNFTNKAKQNV